MRRLKIYSFVLLAFLFSCTKQAEKQTEAAKQSEVKSERKIKGGFIYVGPIGDFGWTHAHEMGRKQVMAKFPWFESVFVESVAEADAPRVIDRLIREENCDIVFTTSFGYMNATINAAKQYPDKKFMHCAGFKREANMGTYMADLYQMYYLNGLLAGALTKTNKIGYIGAHPIPELVRHINSFAIGLKEINPAATIDIKWLFAWYDPAKAKEATEALISEGCDTIFFTQDSPSAIEIAEQHSKTGKQIYTFSHYSPMQKFGENSVVSGQLVDWGIMYEEILRRLYTDTWRNDDLFWLAKEKAAILGGKENELINKKFIPELSSKKIIDPVAGELSVYDLVLKRYQQMSEPTLLFDPFTGPIKSQDGKVRLKAGERANYEMLLSMEWFTENVKGSLPK